jgi:hypothetical protein
MLSWLETTRLAVWLGESPSVWAFPMVLTLHTTGMAVLVGASWLLDLRLLGVSRRIPLSSFQWVFPVMTAGLVLNLVTGLMLFMKNATKWGTAMPFLVKMALVIASVAMLVPIRSLLRRSVVEEPTIGPTAKLLAVASIVAWAGAVSAGRLLAYLIP